VEPNTAVVRHMADTIRHRGPDDSGDFSVASQAWGINLAMRRLAIIDREGGKQPVHAGKVDLVYNGEFYSHRRVRQELQRQGVSFRTECDTEVVARLWDAEGPDCLEKLDGMFALALWDRSRKSLYLVRDRIGKKPLFFWWDEAHNLLVFGSEIKALLAHPHVPREVNPEALYHYLSLQYVPEPLTAYRGIQCVPPGGMVTYKPADGTLEVSSWYELQPREAGEITPADVKGVVTEAILARLEAEVPLGVYLSGGIDSSILAAVIRATGRELHTFSMGFVEDAYNELPLARQTAQRLGTIHHEAIVALPSLPVMAERIVAQYDQPFGDCSAIPTMLLAQESKKYITVALTGDGGDEAFGGYERYWVTKPEQGIIGYLQWLTPIPFGARDRLLDPGFLKSLAHIPHTRGWLVREALTYPGQDLLNQCMWLDVRTYLRNDIIPKMERASMAASVEARCPFLDHRVLELAFGIPSSQKVEGSVGKLILKDAFRDLLPLSVLLRPKRGFSVPISEWFRAEVGRQMLTAMVTDPNWPWGLFHGANIGALLEAHLSGKANLGHAVWMIYMLHAWLKRNF
jgi:asparagine synthase (glutamine-hydrolysing)